MMLMDVSDIAMDVSNDSNSGHFIPPELCACIIESGVLIQPDLHTLAAVSRSFQQEAERYLYNRPVLVNKAKIKGFCTTVLRRPHLAERIVRLTLHMPPQTDFQVADLSRITRTLHLAVNLKFLDIFRESGGLHPPIYPGKGEALQTWILEGHSFKLRCLVNTYFDMQALQPFIHNQPTLQLLVLGCDGKITLQRTLLPRLTHLACPVSVLQDMYIGGAGYRRNIEILSLRNTNSSRESDIMMVQNLFYLRDTLQVLRITKYMCREGLTILGIVMSASMMCLKVLRALEIIDFCWKEGYTDAPFGGSRLPQPFCQLRCLRLCPPFKRPDNPSVSATDSFYVELNTEAGRQAAAMRIMEAIPTLEKLCLITPRYEYVYNRNRGGDGPPMKLTLRSLEPNFIEKELRCL